MDSKLKVWVEAMRLRTLPVSVAGVVFACGLTIYNDGRLHVVPAVLCLAFAVLAQIASNFANEYYDFRDGLDRAGREGPRRGVTEGDITPRAMLTATFITLAMACATGLSLLLYGPWWIVIAGVLIALGVLAYSAGPYPLSRHGWGEVAVVMFFGVIPVWLTCVIQGSDCMYYAWFPGLGVGMMGANVIMVNNYRDMDDDRAVGKRTIAVRFGRQIMSGIYLLSGWVAIGITLPLWLISLPWWWVVVPLLYLWLHTLLWVRLCRLTGAALNPLLGKTAIAMLLYCAAFAIISAIELL